MPALALRRLAVALALASPPAAVLLPGAAGAVEPADVLHQLDLQLQKVVARVSPAVVQIQVTGYGPVDGPGGTVLARQHSLGSGVIIDPSGYVVTNRHVVVGARRIRVLLPAPPGATASRGAGAARGRQYDARVVGLHEETDLALLKIEASGLPTLALGSARTPQPGQLVFAVGSPEGLASTVTMGVISSVSRQTASTGPMLFIQTDAPINPGNSGGPLVDVDGTVVGINAFILSQSGGSQGLGFAIPAGVVKFVADGLKRTGHVHRVELGLGAQEVTPTLAAALGLKRDWGVLVGDVVPEGPAARGGVRPGDLLEAIDGRTVDAFSSMAIALYLHPPGQPVKVSAWRGTELVELSVEPGEQSHPEDPLLAQATPEQNLVPRLGILGVELDARLEALAQQLRRPTGVVVAARIDDPTAVESGLQAGDVIYALNRTAIRTLAQLRAAVAELKPGDPAALFVERQGKLHFLAFEVE